MPSHSRLKRPATPQPPDPAHVLVIDVGGSHIKFRMGGRGAIRRFVSGPDMTAADMAREVRKRARDLPYEAVSIGYPGLVLRGRIAAEPFNLGPGWVGYDFEKTLGQPVRVINDATMQALGSYEGGRMLFLGLGTGLGATLILDGTVEPMEIGHMPYKRGRTFEDYAGERGRERLGNKKWRKAVAEVVVRLKEVLEVDYVVLGGGNAARLKELPPGARRGDNLNAFKGGLYLWRGDDPLAIGISRRQRGAPRASSRP
ncbi:MAG TPA: ROK family protein [Steroidobacteraceae bacterium]|jgi:polyphosphate glucokinase